MTKNSKLEKKGFPVCEYDLDGNYIRTWKNCAAVAKVYNISARSIYDACTFRTYHSYGRQWRYYKQTQGKNIAPLKLKAHSARELKRKLESELYTYPETVDVHYLFTPTEYHKVLDLIKKLQLADNLTLLQKEYVAHIESYILKAQK